MCVYVCMYVQATEALIKPIRQSQTAAAAGLTRGNTLLRISDLARSGGGQTAAGEEQERSHVWKEIKRLQGHGGQPPPEVRDIYIYMCVWREGERWRDINM